MEELSDFSVVRKIHALCIFLSINIRKNVLVDVGYQKGWTLGNFLIAKHFFDC